MDAGVYLIGGKLGTGKGLHAMNVIHDYLRRGRYVLTNMDITPEGIFPAYYHTERLVRLSDFPDVQELNNATTIKSKKYEDVHVATHSKAYRYFGAIVLDELSVWMNSHNWNDPKVLEIRRWIVNARKQGWNVYLISQHPDQIDKQTRESFIQWYVECKAIPLGYIPIIGNFLNTVFSKRFSEDDETGSELRVHYAHLKMGIGELAKTIKRNLVLNPSRLYKGYDTNQVFDINNPSVTGSYSILSPYLIKGRYMSKVQLYKKVAIASLTGGVIIGSIFSYLYTSNKLNEQYLAKKTFNNSR